MVVLISDQKAWFYCKYNLIIESENKAVRVKIYSHSLVLFDKFDNQNLE